MIAVAAATLPLLIGCGVDRGHPRAVKQSAAAVDTAPAARDTYAIGTAVDAHGAIPADAAGETFRRGGEVFVSVDVSSASTDQDIEVKWLDDGGNVLRRVGRRVPRGTRHAPFSSGRTAGWHRGPHRAVILIDGRTVSEKSFGVM